MISKILIKINPYSYPVFLMIKGLAKITQKRQSMGCKEIVCKLFQPYRFPLFIWHSCKTILVKFQLKVNLIRTFYCTNLLQNKQQNLH